MNEIEATRENYLNWLSTLKVGDKVVMISTSFGDEDIYFTEIIKITPKGGIRVKKNISYLFKDGRHSYGAVGKYGNTSHLRLRPVTQEIINKYNRKVRVGKLRIFNKWDELDDETINTIHTILYPKTEATL